MEIFPEPPPPLLAGGTLAPESHKPGQKLKNVSLYYNVILGPTPQTLPRPPPPLEILGPSGLCLRSRGRVLESRGMGSEW